eukprot:COSAG01_NODE_2532_length_7493_cov_2.416960_4_plen_84_part_00
MMRSPECELQRYAAASDWLTWAECDGGSVPQLLRTEPSARPYRYCTDMRFVCQPDRAHYIYNISCPLQYLTELTELVRTAVRT